MIDKILVIDPGIETGDNFATLTVTAKAESSSPGNVKIIAMGSFGGKTDITRQTLFRDNFMKAIDATGKTLQSLAPLTYINDRIWQNYNLGLPYWYRRWVYKYFKWML